jgi:hypothetical protein
MSPASSSALACNTFGRFVDRPDLMPPLPGTHYLGWPAVRVAVEEVARFPWRGGRHSHLDAVIETPDALIGVEAKRFEPFREKPVAEFSEATFRPVWRDDTRPWQVVRDRLACGSLAYRHLDAAQLVKHAFGLSTEAARRGKAAALVYLFHEPTRFPDGRPIRPGPSCRAPSEPPTPLPCCFSCIPGRRRRECGRSRRAAPPRSAGRRSCRGEAASPRGAR